MNVNIDIHMSFIINIDIDIHLNIHIIIHMQIRIIIDRISHYRLIPQQLAPRLVHQKTVYKTRRVARSLPLPNRR